MEVHSPAEITIPIMPRPLKPYATEFTGWETLIYEKLVTLG
ncbi:MAG TPA: hypothetical protein VJ507_02380 [Candidatus Bathyarchaeia archaeon]|nr:hypothetical protein [Candidatus Bathyarchaeia archaeon]